MTARSTARYQSFSLCALLALAFALFSQLEAGALENKVEGYVTAVRMPDGFDVNGQRVALRPDTTYGVMGAKAGDGSHASADDVRIGVFVHVDGLKDAGAKEIMAASVLLRDDWDRKLGGFGVVERILVPGAEPVFQADGYRIHIVASTDLSFGGNMKTLADVGPNTWVYYKGKRDDAGLVVATQARFVPARGWPMLSPRPKTYPKQEPVPERGALMDADGKMMDLHAKVRYGDAGGYCGWHRLSTDQAMQERVLRIGERLVPGYQRLLAADDPAKIRFRFYVVEEDKIREDIECDGGLILVPAKAMERLDSDDEVAALLANGIGLYIQMQSARWIAENRAMLGAQVAADALDFVPGVFPAVTMGNYVVGHEIDMRMQEERGRMALALMADAGYDPWQAPEAWRRIAPKTLPADAASLKYPSRSGYQLGILNLQYASARAAGASSR